MTRLPSVLQEIRCWNRASLTMSTSLAMKGRGGGGEDRGAMRGIAAAGD
jgi:hypothetical protein